MVTGPGDPILTLSLLPPQDLDIPDFAAEDFGIFDDKELLRVGTTELTRHEL